MPPSQKSLKEIFGEALAQESSEERAAYLSNACSHDLDLRKQVDSLMQAHAQCVEANDFLQQNIIPSPIGEGPGSMIGRYKILQQIGEGGFGIVFMAEQQQPVRRMVALKVIKAGMDTREVVARFEAERQALALMDHPNIARVLDGGATDSGRPYFVMDLVKGIPITEFCDERRLPTEARLRLFLQVCSAVQHAHQKGIIHRDLKPTNVLVTLHDGEPVPKVIDFGISKAIGQRLTEKTLFTRFDQLMGTPSYMSPEQAEWSGLDVDTRSDIYSLGVLLYELLTGTTPLEKETLSRAALDEMRRLIRETEPPAPSTRVHALGARAHEIASQRQIELAGLFRLIRGDLDWVVLKALEKDRSRRYETVNAFTRDIENHLEGELVSARPPSTAYRTRKFIRKHRFGVVVASATAISLVFGLILALIGFVHARRETQRATKQAAIAKAANDFLTEDILGQANSYGNIRASDTSIREVLDRAADKLKDQFSADPLVEAAIRFTLGSSYRSIEEFEKAMIHLKRASQIRHQILGPTHPETLHAREELALMTFDPSPEGLGRKNALLRELARTYAVVLGPSDPATLTCLNNLAHGFYQAGRFIEAEEILRDISGKQHLTAPAQKQRLMATARLASVIMEWGHYSSGITFAEEALFAEKQNPGGHTSELFGLLADAYFRLGDYAISLERRKEQVALLQSAFGSTASPTVNALHSLAHHHGAAGQWKECLNTELFRLTNNAPLDISDYLRATTTALLMGDTNTYRVFAEKMDIQFADTTNDLEASTFFVIIASLRSQLFPNSEAAWSRADALPEPWRLLSNEHIAKGMAAYHRSDYQGALRFFEGWRRAPENAHTALRALVAGTFTALIHSQQEDFAGARQCLREVDKLFSAVLSAGELGQNWPFYAIAAIFRMEAESAILGQPMSSIANASSLEQARKRWAPVRRHLNEGNRLAADKQWTSARDEFLTAMQHPLFDWRKAERAHLIVNSVLANSIAVTFALEKDYPQLEKLFEGAFALPEGTSPDPVYAWHMLRTYLALEKSTHSKEFQSAEKWATALFQNSRGVSSEGVALIRVMLAYRLGNFDEVLKNFNTEGRLSVRSASLLFRAMALARIGRKPEGQKDLAQAEAALIKPLKHLTGDLWWDLAMCQLLLDEAHQILK